MRNLTIEELKQIAGGTPAEDNAQSTKNNGWGNGADGETPGTFQGATAPSKIGEGGIEDPNGMNLSSPPDGINTNPVDTSSGR